MGQPRSDQVEVPTPDGVMPAHRWLPKGGSGPGLLLLQEIFGVSDYIRRRGADLAGAGYVVLAPELYWRLGEPALGMADPDVMQQAVRRAQRLDWATTVQDALAALEHLRGSDEVSGAAGLVGFCFGGGLAFNVAAEDDPAVLVSYYGSAIPGLLDLAPRVLAPSLHHFGLADDYIDVATVERIRDAVTGGVSRVEFQTYEGANHAFDNGDIPLHHPGASTLAWRRTLDFLHRELPVPS
jgi:carboxymethylenebutenolidase